MIISIANEKGGVGKTTITFNLACGLVHLKPKSKVLCIDLDAQANLTNLLDNSNENAFSLYDWIKNDNLDFSEVVQQTTKPNVEIIVSNLFSNDLHELMGKDISPATIFKEKLASIKQNYDYVLFDCPPFLDRRTTNALVCSDFAIVPVKGGDGFSISGLKRINEAIKDARRLNPSLALLGILKTMYNGKLVVSKELDKLLEREYPKMVFSNSIREATSLREALMMKQSIFEYDPNSNIEEDFRNFVNEVIQNG